MRQRKLAEAAATFFNVPLEDLKNSRKQKYAWPRNVCAWLADDAKIRKSEIGMFWGRDRTFVYNAVQKVNNDIETDKRKSLQFKAFVGYLRECFKQSK